MNNIEKQERLLDLLTTEAIYGLSSEERKEVQELKALFPEWENDRSFELTAAAFELSAADVSEELPPHLAAKILDDYDRLYPSGGPVSEPAAEVRPRQAEIETSPGIGEWIGQILGSRWLGWSVAAAACLVLAFNFATNRAPQTVATVQPVPSPKVELTLAEQREQLLKSASDVVQTTWSDVDPKKPLNVSGDVVWSNSQQKGFMRFRGMPVNNKALETYQLWIFDENQSDKTPVDGGVFDAGQEGEIIIPINAKLEVKKPVMFAVTAEKPGGVVVSDRKKIMTIAKVNA